jgi:hypothetical protein
MELSKGSHTVRHTCTLQHTQQGMRLAAKHLLPTAARIISAQTYTYTHSHPPAAMMMSLFPVVVTKMSAVSSTSSMGATW